MKAKSVLFLIVSFVFLGIFLYVLMSVIGVELTGPSWAQALYFVATGFAGVVLWEFIGSVSK